jgi:hypothetical protein
MDLGGIALVLLLFVLGLGLAAGTLAWIMGRNNEREQNDHEQVWPEGYIEGEELPPREDAWKPAIWYSDAAKGTLFPNQPSPSFRISADSSFQKAIARRDLEALAADGPTEPDLPSAKPASPPETEDSRLPDEVENLSEIPTQTLHAIPVKDDLPTTLKMRTVARSRITYPLPEELVETVSAAMMEVPAEPEPAPAGSVPSVVADGDEVVTLPAAHDAEVYQELDSPIWVADVEPSQLVSPVVPMTYEIDTSPLVAPLIATAAEEVDTSLVMASPSEAALPVEEFETSHVVAPLYQLEDDSLTTSATAVQPEPEPELELPHEQEEVSDPVETHEQRYERLMVEAYSQVIHVTYDGEFDAISLRFSGCPIRQNSDVPWVFKTISRKLQDALAPATGPQHAMLLDIAGLQVAAEAQAAWEMVLDGFVAQACPEVTPYVVLAIQYDSSSSAGETPEPGEAAYDLQLASSVTGQRRPLIQASSYEAAVVLLQMVRTELQRDRQ